MSSTYPLGPHVATAGRNSATRSKRVLVAGFGVTGQALSKVMVEERADVTAAYDRSSRGDGLPAARLSAIAMGLGVELVEIQDPKAWAELAAGMDEIVVSPGIPAGHPVLSLRGVVSEVEWAARRARVPLVAITGTSGKTTVTTLVTRMLNASGLRALACGNIGLPLAEAVTKDADVLVVEVSSFQLALTESFHPAVAAWLNFAPNHQDWHRSLEEYAQAKARIWANLSYGDNAVINVDDEVVVAKAQGLKCEVISFGLHSGDWHMSGSELLDPSGTVLASLSDLVRHARHDIYNALAASACACAVGAQLEKCREVLSDFDGLPHRQQQVDEVAGVFYVDDSKATTPQAALAACQAFESVVLIAGGRSKGISLRPLGLAAASLRAVVAIGEAAVEIEEVFRGSCTVEVARSMQDAVELATRLARKGDTVLLSPGCASFDWYGSYIERGEDFERCVQEIARRAHQSSLDEVFPSAEGL